MKFPGGFLIFLALAIFGIIASGSLPIRASRSFATHWFAPVFKKSYATSRKGENLFETINKLRSLLARIEELEAKNTELDAKLIRFNEFKNENALLRKELSAKASGSQKLLSAEVVGRVPNRFRNIIHINRGLDDGVRVGFGVIAQGFLVGKVKEARKKTSLVTLISDHSFMATAMLQNSRTLGLIRGGNAGIIMEQVPVSQTISENEPIISSGLAGEIPSQIPIGTAGEKISSQADIFQTIKVNSPIDFNKLEFVFVIISP